VLPGCTIPGGYRETTTQAARDRGQRVFTGTSGAEAIYVRTDSSCVSLAAIPPLPEFAPDGPLGVDDPPSVRTSFELPETGSGAPGRDGAVFALLAGLAGLTGALSFMLVSRRR
jgi:hypothetical protein